MRIPAMRDMGNKKAPVRAGAHWVLIWLPLPTHAPISHNDYKTVHPEGSFQCGETLRGGFAGVNREMRE